MTVKWSAFTSGTSLALTDTLVALQGGVNVQITGLLAIAAGKSLTVSNTLTLAGTDASTLNIGAGGTLGTSAFITLGAGVGTWLATPSSANLASAMTDETGTGPLVFASAPTFTTTIQLGTVSSATGQIKLANSASVNLTTIQAGNAANARTYIWPTDFGAAGTVLTDAAGNGTLSWAAGGGGLTIGTTTITSGTTTRILYDNAGVVGEYTITGTGTVVAMQTSPNFLTSLTLNTTTILTWPAAATFQLGAADVDTGPVAQTLRTQGALVGGTSNVAGANFTIGVSPGKGTGAGGSFIVQTAPAGSSGTTLNALATALTIDSTKTATFAGLVVTGVGAAGSGGGGYAFVGDTGTGWFHPLTGELFYYSASSAYMGLPRSTDLFVRMRNTVNLSWTSGGPDATADDLILSRAAAATLQFGGADANPPVAQTLRVQSVVAGTLNTAGADWTDKMSAGTGTAAGGKRIFQTAAASTSGTSQNSLATVLTLDGPGNVVCGNAAIATNATDGFLYVDSCAGSPSGTPTTFTGRVPLVFDTTNNQFWIYTSGSWHQPKTPAGAALVTWQ